MSQDQPFMSKSHSEQFGRAPKWGEMESQEISKSRQTVLARLMESQIWHLPASSVALQGEDPAKVKGLLPTFLSERKLSP